MDSNRIQMYNIFLDRVIRTYGAIPSMSGIKESRQYKLMSINGLTKTVYGFYQYTPWSWYVKDEDPSEVTYLATIKWTNNGVIKSEKTLHITYPFWLGLVNSMGNETSISIMINDIDTVPLIQYRDDSLSGEGTGIMEITILGDNYKRVTYFEHDDTARAAIAYKINAEIQGSSKIEFSIYNKSNNKYYNYV